MQEWEDERGQQELKTLQFHAVQLAQVKLMLSSRVPQSLVTYTCYKLQSPHQHPGPSVLYHSSSNPPLLCQLPHCPLFLFFSLTWTLPDISGYSLSLSLTNNKKTLPPNMEWAFCGFFTVLHLQKSSSSYTCMQMSRNFTIFFSVLMEITGNTLEAILSFVLYPCLHVTTHTSA